MQGLCKRLYVIGTHASRQSALDEAEDVVRYKLTGEPIPGRGRDIVNRRYDSQDGPPPPRYDDRGPPPPRCAQLATARNLHAGCLASARARGQTGPLPSD